MPYATCYVFRDPARRGFALLFAILASSVLMSISVAIWNLALREVVLSSFGRESQVAFYAADTGTECALYWDIKGIFATSTNENSPPVFMCAEQGISTASVPPLSVVSDDRNATTTFSISTTDTCVDVVVTKNDPDGDGYSFTRIEAFGHNVCSISDPTRVERGFKISY